MYKKTYGVLFDLFGTLVNQEQPEYIKDGAKDLLTALQDEKIPLGLVTSLDKASTLQIIESHDIKQYFDVIITKEDCQRQKPHPEPYLRAAAGIEMVTFDCLVFEDSAMGMEAADQAGMKIVAVDTTEINLAVRKTITNFTEITTQEIKKIMMKA